MVEVVRTLSDRERGSYMPADELFDKRQRNEVYVAVGEHLMQCYETQGAIPSSGDLLLELHSGTQVCFSYGDCTTLEAVH